nr:Clas15 [Darna trima granulovirus]
MFTISLQNQNIPVLYVNAKVYIGFTDLQEYYGINCKNNDTDVLSECYRYDELIKSSAINDKLFITKVGAVLLLESNGVKYQCYWCLFSVIDNVLVVMNETNGNGGGNDDLLPLLKTIANDVQIIKDYVTVDPFK